MKQRILLMNLALLAVAAGCLWQLRQNHQQASHRQTQLLRQNAAALPIAHPTPAQQNEPKPADYAGIALRNLFSPDRHPHLAPEPDQPEPPKPPVPAFPKAQGVLNLGDGPVALLTWEGRQKPYRQNEPIGPWKLVAIATDHLELEWNGERFTRPLEPAQAEPNETNPTEAKPERNEPKPPPPPNPWHCQPNDSTPVGTVKEGRRKMETVTPFGTVCRWEPV